MPLNSYPLLDERVYPIAQNHEGGSIHLLKWELRKGGWKTGKKYELFFFVKRVQKPVLVNVDLIFFPTGGISSYHLQVNIFLL